MYITQNTAPTAHLMGRSNKMNRFLNMQLERFQIHTMGNMLQMGFFKVIPTL